MTIQPIETRYKGYRFRSRLEARWAVFFDAMGLLWEYEREGYQLGDGDFYLPDFWLPEVRMFGEVKPEKFNERELRLAGKLHRACLMLVGPPDFKAYWSAPGSEKPPECFPPNWSTDYIIDTRFLDEHRFYSCTGWDEYTRLELEGDLHYRGCVEAARAARFEHGETPR